jgi:hypothetical protein
MCVCNVIPMRMPLADSTFARLRSWPRHLAIPLYFWAFYCFGSIYVLEFVCSFDQCTCVVSYCAFN